MAIKIPPDKIQNLQRIEAVVAGPDEANRLLIIDGQFDSVISAVSQTDDALRKEIFSVLVGPVFNRKQFVNATATASIVNTFSRKSMCRRLPRTGRSQRRTPIGTMNPSRLN